jgi:hypothetical protein
VEVFLGYTRIIFTIPKCIIYSESKSFIALETYTVLR